MTAPVRHAHAVEPDPFFPAGLVVGVRDVESVVGEKRLRLVCAGIADVVHQSVGDHLGRVIDGHLRHAGSLVLWADALGPPVVVQHISQLHLAAVMDEKLGVKIVRVVHVDVAVKLVEAVALRVVQRRRIADAPLTEAAGLVAVFLEHLGEGEVTWLQLARAVATDPGVAGMQAGHQHATRRCTNCAAGVVTREAHAFFGHAVEVRGAQRLLAVTTEVAPAKVVREDVNDIGPLCLRLAKREQQAKRDENTFGGPMHVRREFLNAWPDASWQSVVSCPR